MWHICCMLTSRCTSSIPSTLMTFSRYVAGSDCSRRWYIRLYTPSPSLQPFGSISDLRTLPSSIWNDIIQMQADVNSRPVRKKHKSAVTEKCSNSANTTAKTWDGKCWTGNAKMTSYHRTFFIRKWQQNFCDIILQHNSGKCVEKSKTAENRDEKEAEKSNHCVTGVYSMISDQWFDDQTFFTLHETVPNNAVGSRHKYALILFNSKEKHWSRPLDVFCCFTFFLQILKYNRTQHANVYKI